MRILNVGDFNWMTGRESHTSNTDLFAIRSKLTNAAIRAGHSVVEYSDRAVSRVATPLRSRRLGQAAANRGFVRLVDDVRPDLVLLNNVDELTNDTLDACRRLVKGLTIVDIAIDPLPDPKTLARLHRRKGVVDVAFVTTAGEGLATLAGNGGFAAYMPNPVDRAVETERVFERLEPRFDLILPVNDDEPRSVGGSSLRPSAALDRLRRGLPGLRVTAPGLESPRLRGVHYTQALADARIGWALSRHNDQPLYASDRMAHMLGNGLLTCLDAKSGFQCFYGVDEAIFYRDLADLIAQLERVMHEAELARGIAQRGWRRTWALFDVGRVFAYLLAQIYDEGGAEGYEWPCQRWSGG